MTNVFAANVVRVIHILFMLWMAVVPFTNNEPMLVLHLIVNPFLWLHWITNQDACSLTLLEMYLRGVPPEKSFFHSVVSPVYKIDDETLKGLCWTISIALWLITLSKVMKRPKMITDVFTLKVPQKQVAEESSQAAGLQAV
jgi:hypothetical protein